LPAGEQELTTVKLLVLLVGGVLLFEQAVSMAEFKEPPQTLATQEPLPGPVS
jgi:hypothetical protein